MRHLDVKCDNCKQPKTPDAPTWWSLEDLGLVTRTRPLDLCSLTCLAQFLSDPRIRQFYAADFAHAPGAPLSDRYSSLRIRSVVLFRRWLIHWFTLRIR